MMAAADWIGAAVRGAVNIARDVVTFVRLELRRARRRGRHDGT